MGPDADRVERDYASYRLLVDLWASENPVKTVKLLALLGTNALLVAALSIAGGLIPRTWPLCLAGAAFSLIFVLSLGRTSLFQEGWRLKIREIASRYPEDARFQVLEAAGERAKASRIMRLLGSVPSAYYILGAPVLLLLCWLGALAILVM